eukprot:CAMPEP_0197030504 /NCGR_PEP_ID=MMETSP1384-20130603/9727_1 /TAXON_ID=29189 /ORGANISM="Ammonia sp." /LENGTH=1108 /DNA_ID=CAMNT_0042459875 /DNA_START=32 /DNA_END=3358 /DNA_ORIENTATION=-
MDHFLSQLDQLYADTHNVYVTVPRSPHSSPPSPPSPSSPRASVTSQKSKSQSNRSMSIDSQPSPRPSSNSDESEQEDEEDEEEEEEEESMYHARHRSNSSNSSLFSYFSEELSDTDQADLDDDDEEDEEEEEDDADKCTESEQAKDRQFERMQLDFMFESELLSDAAMSEDEEDEWRDNHQYIDIDDFDLDDADADLENRHYLKILPNDGQPMDKIETELNEINRWIQLLNGIDRLSKLKKRRVNKHICIEITAVSVDELRMKWMTATEAEHESDVSDICSNVSFAEYPSISDIDIGEYSLEELRYCESDQVSVAETQIIGDDLFDDAEYEQFDEIDVQINECVAYYRHNAFTMLPIVQHIRANMTGKAANKDKVAKNALLRQALFKLLDWIIATNINVRLHAPLNEHLQSLLDTILEILRYLTFRNASAMIGNTMDEQSERKPVSILVDLALNPHHHWSTNVQRKALHIVGKLAAESDVLRDIVLENNVLDAMVQVLCTQHEDGSCPSPSEKLVMQIQTTLAQICSQYLWQIFQRNYIDIKHVPNMLKLCSLLVRADYFHSGFCADTEQIFAYLTEMNQALNIYDGHLVLSSRLFLKQYNTKHNLLLFDGYMRQHLSTDIIVHCNVSEVYLRFTDMFKVEIETDIFDSLYSEWKSYGPPKLLNTLLDALFTNDEDVETLIKAAKFVYVHCRNIVIENEFNEKDNELKVTKEQILQRMTEFMRFEHTALQRYACKYLLQLGVYSNDELRVLQQCQTEDNGKHQNHEEEATPEIDAAFDHCFDGYPSFFATSVLRQPFAQKRSRGRRDRENQFSFSTPFNPTSFANSAFGRKRPIYRANREQFKKKERVIQCDITAEIDPLTEELEYQYRTVQAYRWDEAQSKWRSRGTGKLSIYFDKMKGLDKLIFLDEHHDKTRLLQYIDGSKYASEIPADSEHEQDSDLSAVQFYGHDYSMDAQNPLDGKWKFVFSDDAEKTAASEFLKVFNKCIDGYAGWSDQMYIERKGIKGSMFDWGGGNEANDDSQIASFHWTWNSDEHVKDTEKNKDKDAEKADSGGFGSFDTNQTWDFSKWIKTAKQDDADTNQDDSTTFSFNWNFGGVGSGDKDKDKVT